MKTKVKISGIGRQRQAEAVDLILDRYDVDSVEVNPSNGVITVEGDNLDVNAFREDFPRDNVNLVTPPPVVHDLSAGEASM